MIACKICQSPQFLQIMNSKFRFHAGEPAEVYEKYECVFCGPTAVGALRITADGERELTGSIIDIETERPRAEI